MLPQYASVLLSRPETKALVLFEVSCIVVQAAASSSPKTGLAKIHQLKATDSVDLTTMKPYRGALATFHVRIQNVLQISHNILSSVPPDVTQRHSHNA